MVRPRHADGAVPNLAPPAGKDGMWYATCNFGGGAGEVFQVYALVLPPDLNAYMDPNAHADFNWLEAHALHKTRIYVATKQ
jgi:hypothetical protein